MTDTTNTESKALVNALAFAARGYAVLPLHGIAERGSRLVCTCGDGACGSPGKHPHGRLAPHGLKDATTDRATVKAWFEELDWLNYGVCTDTLPTVDIDPRHGGDKAWLKLVRENYDVHTWRVLTGGGGQHILFAAPAKPVPSAKLVRGIDVKGAAGYVVGPGSLHASGNRYSWFYDGHPCRTPLVAPPQWLVDKLDSKASEQKWNGEPRTQSYFNTFLEPALPGERHARVAALIGHLFGSAFPNRGVLLALAISHIKLTYPDLEGFDMKEIVDIALGIARSEDGKAERA